MGTSAVARTRCLVVLFPLAFLPKQTETQANGERRKRVDKAQASWLLLVGSLVARGCVGVRAEAPTEESIIAFLAAKRADENHRQDSLFQESLASGEMDS